MKFFERISQARQDAKETVLRGREIPAGFWQGTDALSNEIMLETINYGFTTTIPNSLQRLEQECEPDLPWAHMHFNERISGKPLNPGESYKIWPYNKFKDGNDPYLKGGSFSHTYMERYWPAVAGEDSGRTVGDLNDVIEMFKANLHTRQGYLPVWFPEDTGNRSGVRVPCTLGYHFYYRGGSMNVNYFIRSCDFYRHFKNDIYLTCRLAQHIMKEIAQTKKDIKYDMGYITMFITHFHVFKNDLYLIRKGNY